jgi:hypothetical protein
MPKTMKGKLFPAVGNPGVQVQLLTGRGISRRTFSPGPGKIKASGSPGVISEKRVFTAN